MGDNGKTAVGRALMINARHCSCKYCNLSARASNAVIVFSNGRLSICELLLNQSQNINIKSFSSYFSFLSQKFAIFGSASMKREPSFDCDNDKNGLNTFLLWNLMMIELNIH
jgi:hypothetical protein